MRVAKVPDATPGAVNDIRAGQLPWTFSPSVPKWLARASGTVAIILPTHTDFLHDSADDTSKSPAPEDRLAYSL